MPVTTSAWPVTPQHVANKRFAAGALGRVACSNMDIGSFRFVQTHSSLASRKWDFDFAVSTAFNPIDTASVREVPNVTLSSESLLTHIGMFGLHKTTGRPCARPVHESGCRRDRERIP